MELNEQAAEEQLKQVIEAKSGLSAQEAWRKLIEEIVEASHAGLTSVENK